MAKEFAKEVAAKEVAAKEFAKEVAAREVAAKEFGKKVAAKEVAAEEVVVKRRVSHDVVGEEGEFSSRGDLRETVAGEKIFVNGFKEEDVLEKEIVGGAGNSKDGLQEKELVDLIILFKLVQGERGGEGAEADGKGRRSGKS